jgi:NAD(P)-dependent dehydrogenase (short-subunit alcohol dehydrogenase family)
MFAGKFALVSGSSIGIGRAIAIGFARNGARVALVARTQSNLEETSRLCIEAAKSSSNSCSSDHFPCIVADLSKVEECERVGAECERLFGRLDFLVNNLGTYQNSCLETLTKEQFDSLMNSNLRAHVFLTRHTLQLLARSGSASIVNISSLSGLRPVPNALVNCLAKTAINAFTQCTALELASKGIRVNAICPGITESKPDFSEFGLDEAATKKFFQQSASSNPQTRNTSVEDVVEAALFLCDQTRASRMTGVLLPLDGGFSLQMPKYT